MLREVREETGLVDIVPVAGFKKVIEYYYKRDGRTVHKEVTFFLAESKEEQGRPLLRAQGLRLAEPRGGAQGSSPTRTRRCSSAAAEDSFRNR